MRWKVRGWERVALWARRQVGEGSCGYKRSGLGPEGAIRCDQGRHRTCGLSVWMDGCGRPVRALSSHPVACNSRSRIDSSVSSQMSGARLGVVVKYQEPVRAGRGSVVPRRSPVWGLLVVDAICPAEVGSIRACGCGQPAKRQRGATERFSARDLNTKLMRRSEAGEEHEHTVC